MTSVRNHFQLHIPADATTLANHWAIDLDEYVYGADVSDFRPSRCIENPDLPLASFGYRRRVCTGQHVAMNTLSINASRLLWAFSIEHAVDEQVDRNEADPLGYTQGFSSVPLPFKARFVVRSPDRKAAVEKAWTDVEKDVVVPLDDVQKPAGKMK